MKEVRKDYTKRVGLAVIAIFGAAYLYYTWLDSKENQTQYALQVAKTAVATLPIKELNGLDAKAEDVNKVGYQLIKNNLASVISVNSKARFAYVYVLKNGRV